MTKEKLHNLLSKIKIQKTSYNNKLAKACKILLLTRNIYN